MDIYPKQPHGRSTLSGQRGDETMKLQILISSMTILDSVINSELKSFQFTEILILYLLSMVEIESLDLISKRTRRKHGRH
jgi:hypothetical protein